MGWKSLSQEVKLLQNTYPDTFVFAMDGYKTSAQLRFFLDQKVYAQNIIGENALHFSYLGDDLNLLEGRNAIYIDSDKRFKNDQKKGTIHPDIEANFASVKELEPIIIFKGTTKARKFWVFYCTKYQPKK